MPQISDLMSAEAASRLAESAELEATERLLEERGQQRPAPVPPPLDDLAERDSQQRR